MPDYFNDQIARAQELRDAIQREGRVADRTRRVEIVDTEDGPYVVNELVSADVMTHDDAYVERLVLLNHAVFKCQRRIQDSNDVAGVCRLCFRENLNPILCKDHYLVCKKHHHLVCREHGKVEYDGTVWCDEHRPAFALRALKRGAGCALLLAPGAIGLALLGAMGMGMVFLAIWVFNWVMRQ